VTILQYILWSVLKVAVVTVVMLLGIAYTVLLERKLVAASRIAGAQPRGTLWPAAAAGRWREVISQRRHYSQRRLSAALSDRAHHRAGLHADFYWRGSLWRAEYRAGQAGSFEIANVNIGLLVILGVTSIGVYGIALAGWSSNNKYSLLGALRSSAQLVSYELALGLSLVGVVLRAGSLNLRVIVEQQATQGMLTWNVFGGMQFVAFFIYLTAAYAETNRSPFDLPEAESELTGGYHTEYSSMKFAMFFMAEYGNMITVAAWPRCCSLAAGPALRRPDSSAAEYSGSRTLPIFWFVLKVFCFLFLYVWVRGTLPRFRYDQLMNYGWRWLMPLAILNIVATSLWLAYR